MTRFQGSIQMIDDRDSGVRTEMTVEEGRLLLTAGGDEIGSWTVDGLAIQRHGDGFRVDVEEEVFLLKTEDVIGFAEAMGIRESDEPVRQPRLRPALQRWARVQTKRLSQVPTKWKVAVSLAVVVVVLAAVARGFLALVFSLLGAVLLLVGIFAHLNPIVAARFPGSWTSDRVLVVGLVMLIGGGVLTWLS